MLVYRVWINAAIHLFLFSASYFYCIIIANGLVIDEIVLHTFVKTIGPLLVLRMVVFFRHDLFQGMWRYVGFEDLTNIIRATIISSLLFYVLGLIWDEVAVSEQLYLMDLVFCVVMAGGVRYLVRNFREKYFRRVPSTEIKRVFLVGPLLTVQPLLKELLSNPGTYYHPVAIIDPEKTTTRGTTRISDIPIWSVGQALGRRKRLGPVQEIILCWPEAGRRRINRLVEQLEVFQAVFKKIPFIEDIIANKVSVNDIREVEIEDLLERPPVNIELEKIEEYLNHKIVLITGGAGSIGSEICRQVAKFHPKNIVVVDRSENSLYEFQLAFKNQFPGISMHSIISSVNDAEGMHRLMLDMKVDVVFHAAAYKHVPLMEAAPIESAYNNICGTFNVVRAAIKADIKRFVMISTDKAVNPTNVMGVTKRIAEMIVQSFNGYGKTRFMTVRFGNVLGSAGSVIPIFKNQIRKGLPITVTHPDIERYFMTIPEAVQLVLQAACMGKGGEIFVLDMGRPVKILHLAEKLIALSGKRPHDDVEIKFTGLRPGEKMYEELFNTAETHLETSHPRIKAAVSEKVFPETMQGALEDIKTIVAAKDLEALRQKMMSLVPGYQCQYGFPCVKASEQNEAAKRAKRTKAAPDHRISKPVLPEAVGS